MPTPSPLYMLRGEPTRSPRFDHPLKGQAIADFFKSVLTAYSDLRFDVISCGDTGGGWVATQLRP